MRSHVPQFGQIVRRILLLFLLSVLSAAVGKFHDLDLQGDASAVETGKAAPGNVTYLKLVT